MRCLKKQHHYLVLSSCMKEKKIKIYHEIFLELLKENIPKPGDKNFNEVNTDIFNLIEKKVFSSSTHFEINM